MIFHDDQWHLRLYRWSRKVWLHFWNQDIDQVDSRVAVGLCPYVRTIFLYMPLIVALHLGVFAAAGYVLLVQPIMWFGALPFGIFIGKLVGIVAVAAVCIGGIVGVVMAIAAISEWLENRTATHKVKRVAPDDRPSFSRVIRMWWKAIHDRMCPLIEIKHTET